MIEPIRFPAFLSPLTDLGSLKWRSRAQPHVARRRPTRSAVSMGTSMPEIPEVQLPEPPVPKQSMDPKTGTETAVESAQSVESGIETSWLESVLMSRENIEESHPLAQLRKTSEAALNDLPLPHRKQEPWRFTNLKSVYTTRYLCNTSNVDQNKLSMFNATEYMSDVTSNVLVFVDGKLNEGISLINENVMEAWRDAGGYVGSVTRYKGDVKHLHDMWSTEEMSTNVETGGLFPTLGNAVACDAAVIDVPRDFKAEAPVALCFVSTSGTSSESATMSAPRVAIIAHEGSSVDLLECHISLNANESFSTAFTGSAINVKDGASVTHYLATAPGSDAHVFGNLHAIVQNDASYSLRCLGLGGKVSRVTVGIELEGERSSALLHGGLLADGNSIQDIHSRISHNSRNTRSDQVQKNVSSDHGHAIFSGKIIVTENSRDTEAHQLSNSLLMSKSASIDAMPVLEIANDDVQCSHGATVSDLSEDELFYCRSRGLSHRQAQSLLVMGFARGPLGNCPFPSVIELVRKRVESISASSGERDTKGTLYMST